MALQSYQELLSMASQLPLNSQVKLAEALLHKIQLQFPMLPDAANGLLPLLELSDAELKALADTVVAAERQQQVKAALRKQRQEGLTPEETAALDKLLAEADQVALLKARPMYTLKLRQATSIIKA